MRRAERLLLGALLGALPAAPLAGAAPATVSPGEPERAVEISGACPTFSWATGADVQGYELAVFALGERDEPELVLRRAVAGAASSWTPARADCLAPGADYAWTVRARDAGGRDTAWSAPRRFRVPETPAPDEVAAAVAVLARWRGRSAGAAGAARGRDVLAPPPLGARGAGPAGGAPAAAIAGTFAGSNGAGVSGIATDATGTVSGVRGETASSWGAGVTGVSNATTNNPVGVYGEITATQGFAVWGRAPETTGYSYGVRGDASGTAGAGVYGIAWDTTGS